MKESQQLKSLCWRLEMENVALKRQLVKMSQKNDDLDQMLGRFEGRLRQHIATMDEGFERIGRQSDSRTPS